MSQLIVLVGKVEKKGKLSQTEKGNSYIRIVLLELGGNKENELPITFWGDNATKVNDTIQEGMMVQCEPELSSFENKKYDHTWYNLTLTGKGIKELKFEEYKKNNQRRATPSNIRKFAQDQIEKHDNSDEKTSESVTVSEANNSSQSGMSNIVKENQTSNISSNNSVSNTGSTSGDEDGFDASLFDDM